MTAPIVREHGGVWVVRDDLFPGGTKARFMPVLFEGAEEAVYASPAEGGAQTALATVAKDLGKRATIFVAARANGVGFSATRRIASIRASSRLSALARA